MYRRGVGGEAKGDRAVRPPPPFPPSPDLASAAAAASLARPRSGLPCPPLPDLAVGTRVRAGDAPAQTPGALLHQQRARGRQWLRPGPWSDAVQTPQHPPLLTQLDWLMMAGLY